MARRQQNNKMLPMKPKHNRFFSLLVLSQHCRVAPFTTSIFPNNDQTDTESGCSSPQGQATNPTMRPGQAGDKSVPIMRNRSIIFGLVGSGIDSKESFVRNSMLRHVLSNLCSEGSGHSGKMRLQILKLTTPHKSNPNSNTTISATTTSTRIDFIKRNSAGARLLTCLLR